MKAIDFKSDIQNIIFQGFLEKQSRILKTWRKRWCVITSSFLYTFKEQKQYTAPTETIPLNTITSIKKSDEQTHRQFSFRIQTSQNCFFVVASSNSQRQKWLGSIGAAMMKARRKQQEQQP